MIKCKRLRLPRKKRGDPLRGKEIANFSVIISLTHSKMEREEGFSIVDDSLLLIAKLNLTKINA